jgi:hypothetical protein
MRFKYRCSALFGAFREFRKGYSKWRFADSGMLTSAIGIGALVVRFFLLFKKTRENSTL